MKLRKLSKNSFAVAMMYDAVLFIVMVSMSGAVLIPALQSDVAVEGSIEKHREEIVDETLLMLMTSRADDFGYTLAGSQIEMATGIDVDYASSNPDIIQTLVKTFLGREQKHKTYADLCVESLVCQVKTFGTRINIFTEDYDESLREEITTILNNYLGEKYEFRFVIRWKPIMGIDFGGDLEIGPIPPESTHVAKSYVTLPNTFFSDWLKGVEEYIEDEVNNVVDWANDDAGLKLQIKNMTSDILEGLVVKGFNGQPSIINKTIDYVFKPVEKGIGNIFGSSAGMFLDPVKAIYPDVENLLSSYLVDAIGSVSGINMSDTDGDGFVNITEGLDSVKGHISGEVSGILSGLFDGYLDSFADYIVETIDVVLDLEGFQDDLVNFFKDHINVLRAEIVLTVWEVRG